MSIAAMHSRANSLAVLSECYYRSTVLMRISTCWKRACSSVRLIDLRSDTVTQPTPKMRELIAAAVVGDDVYEEDPTVKALENEVGSLLNMESALYFPTGTMSNLAAVFSWCDRRGAEMIVGNRSHLFMDEQGGAAQYGGVSSMPQQTIENGTWCVDTMESSIRKARLHNPITCLIALENTHAKCGGRIVPQSFVEHVGTVAAAHNIPLHMDGSRIWHAAIEGEVPVSALTASATSVSVCLSKGLGAPMGSVLAGPDEFIRRAKRVRKGMGGGMRQVGHMAAAGLEALRYYKESCKASHISKTAHNRSEVTETRGVNLGADHRRAKDLGVGVGSVDGFWVDNSTVETNIVLVRVDSDRFTAADIVQELRAHGILCVQAGLNVVRLVTHMDISDADIDSVITAFHLINNSK